MAVHDAPKLADLDGTYAVAEILHLRNRSCRSRKENLSVLVDNRIIFLFIETPRPIFYAEGHDRYPFRYCIDAFARRFIDKISRFPSLQEHPFGAQKCDRIVGERRDLGAVDHTEDAVFSVALVFQRNEPAQVIECSLIDDIISRPDESLSLSIDKGKLALIFDKGAEGCHRIDFVEFAVDDDMSLPVDITAFDAIIGQAAIEAGIVA